MQGVSRLTSRTAHRRGIRLSHGGAIGVARANAGRGPGRAGFTFLDGGAWRPPPRSCVARPGIGDCWPGQKVTNGPVAARTLALPWWCDHFNSR